MVDLIVLEYRGGILLLLLLMDILILSNNCWLPEEIITPFSKMGGFPH